MILMGSRALALRAPYALFRKPLDFDFVCTKEEALTWLDKNFSKIQITKEPYYEGFGESKDRKLIVEANTPIEFELVEPGTSSEILRQLVEHNSESLETPFGWVPTFDLLFTIKSSHKYLKNSPHFWKTLTDYHVMKKLGAKIRPEYQDFLKSRERETYAKQKHPSLMQTKENFFKDDGIQYVFEHDDIHESVKSLEKPAYRYYMKDGSEVFSDKKKFFACPRETQLLGVVEEAATLAIERSLVPHPNVWTPEYAWKFALAKVCSSITSGFFREFAYENALEVLKMYPKNYWEKFQKDVSEGKVRYIGK